MDQGIAAVEAHPRGERVCYGREHVHQPPALGSSRLVGGGQRLKRRGAGGEGHVVPAPHDLPGDGVGLSQVSLGVVAADRHRAAVDEALLREAVEHPPDRVVEQGRAHLLEHGHRRYRPPR